MGAEGADRHQVVASRLSKAGCVAAEDEAAELLAAAGADEAVLEQLVGRREAGMPLAWVIGAVTFADWRVLVHPGVYVPRRQTEGLARRAAELLPDDGVAADLCTGSGAVALVLQRARPGARVLATDIDPLACSCAAANGVEVHLGDLAEPLLPELRRRCDVVTAVPPYVPIAELRFLPRDARDHEPVGALDGGPDGCKVLTLVVQAATELLRDQGTLLLELGGEEEQLLAGCLDRAGLRVRRRLEDDDGDVRGIEVVRQRA